MKLRFLNLNLWQGNLLFEAINFIKKENPDIISLQEVYGEENKNLQDQFRSLAVLRKELGISDFFFSPAFIHNRYEGKFVNGNGILSRYPIKAKHTYFYDTPFSDNYLGRPDTFITCPRNLQECQVNVNGFKVNIFNTQGIWGLDGEDNERRLKMAEIIIDKIKNKDNVILSGDFNVREQTKTIALIEKHLINIFKKELTTTFNLKRKNRDLSGYAESVVDIIFVSPSIKVVDHRCPAVDVSDHFPLVCDFEI